MTPGKRLAQLGRRLHETLGGPGLMIGVFSVLSFGFGLYVLATEYDRPRRTGRAAVDRVVAGWVRVADYLGLTLVDHVDLWREAEGGERELRREMLRQALDRLGAELDHQGERLPLVHVVAMELVTPAEPEPLASWRSPILAGSEGTEVTDTIDLEAGTGAPAVVLRVRYRIGPAFEAVARGLESSYRRLLLAVLGLSGFSLLCLGYMIMHAQALRERVAREAAQEATLDLADRTCHELGNGVFVLANERRNLAEHLDLVEKFLAEGPGARRAAARSAGVGPDLETRWEQAVRREYAARGIDPERDLRGSATVARHVCRQIGACSEYIAMTVRELDGFLKRTALPVTLERVEVDECIDEAVALLRPRLDAAEATVRRAADTEVGLHARADRRLFIHVLVNLLKNAVESVTRAAPEITVGAYRDGRTVRVTVSDNGPGIPTGSLARVFEDGFSTKGPGRGRGLAIVRESVEMQEGEIEVTTAPAGGAVFRIGLPADPQDEAPATPPPPGSVPPHEGPAT